MAVAWLTLEKTHTAIVMVIHTTPVDESMSSEAKQYTYATCHNVPLMNARMKVDHKH